MSASLALLAFIVGIAVLFYLDRDASARTSKALWLPVIWFWIASSRPVSSWLGMGTLRVSESSSTSPLDEIIAFILIALGIIVIARRKEVVFLLKSWPIALYFTFCLLSVLWADFPAQGFKRWIRAAGELVMVMVVATDPQPIPALKRFFSRVGFILLPVSVLLLKYYPALGRAYDAWGWGMNVGVANDKNMLGVMTYVIGLGTVWQLLVLLRDKDQPNRRRHMVAHFVMLYLVVTLLITAHSATSGTCFALGAVFMTIAALPIFGRSPAAVHAFVLAILLAGGLTVLLGGKAAAAEAVGRDATFTGRTRVWALVIPMQPNPLLGAGFENFWFGPRLDAVWAVYRGTNEAHDGYIEVYLNLGLIGVALIVLILIQGYRKGVGAFRKNPSVGGLLVAYVLTATIYSVTEAGFRMLDPIWFCLLLAGILANRLTAVGQELPQSSSVLTAPDFGMTVGGHRPIGSIPRFTAIGTSKSSIGRAQRTYPGPVLK